MWAETATELGKYNRLCTDLNGRQHKGMLFAAFKQFPRKSENKYNVIFK